MKLNFEEKNETQQQQQRVMAALYHMPCHSIMPTTDDDNYQTDEDDAAAAAASDHNGLCVLGYLLWYLEHLLKSHSNKNPRSEKNFPSTMRPNGWLAAWLSSADNHRHISYLVLCGLTGDEVEAEDGIGWIVWTTMRRDLFLSSCVSECVLSLTLLCVSHYILGFFLVLDADTLLCGVALVKETMSEPRHMGK